MNVVPIASQFYTEDFSEWKTVRNRDTQAMWLRKDNANIKIHIRLDSDGEYFIRMYRFADIGDFTGMNYRITLTPEELSFDTLVLDGSNENSNLLAIGKYNELLQEGQFFQESLVNDFGDLEHSDIVQIANVRNKVIEATKGLL